MTVNEAASPTIQQLVGARICAARKDAGLTQQQVADRIGLTRTSVVNMEAGRQEITLTRFACLAEILRLNLAELVREGELPPAPHAVSIRRVYELECSTCQAVIGEEPTRARALEAERDHVAKMRGR
jgi:transcriptional regulator with XRE-family HTH domain